MPNKGRMPHVFSYAKLKDVTIQNFSIRTN